ncbi:hypothetical protein [Halomarina oriensis]|uniref:Uncharacterized protein n=1 Tax=Halomarina oriensis TaxID=671145 RepID=A0A6B0GMD5_9EURY|nr:hypothetical protein [Halomarina oriensis]MWG35904.1 hypothetical protein [Halomarina oriensis]
MADTSRFGAAAGSGGSSSSSSTDSSDTTDSSSSSTSSSTESNSTSSTSNDYTSGPRPAIRPVSDSDGGSSSGSSGSGGGSTSDSGSTGVYEPGPSQGSDSTTDTQSPTGGSNPAVRPADGSEPNSGDGGGSGGSSSDSSSRPSVRDNQTRGTNPLTDVDGDGSSDYGTTTENVEDEAPTNPEPVTVSRQDRDSDGDGLTQAQNQNIDAAVQGLEDRALQDAQGIETERSARGRRARQVERGFIDSIEAQQGVQLSRDDVAIVEGPNGQPQPELVAAARERLGVNPTDEEIARDVAGQEAGLDAEDIEVTRSGTVDEQAVSVALTGRARAERMRQEILAENPDLDPTDLVINDQDGDGDLDPRLTNAAKIRRARESVAAEVPGVGANEDQISVDIDDDGRAVAELTQSGRDAYRFELVRQAPEGAKRAVAASERMDVASDEFRARMRIAEANADIDVEDLEVRRDTVLVRNSSGELAARDDSSFGLTEDATREQLAREFGIDESEIELDRNAQGGWEADFSAEAAREIQSREPERFGDDGGRVLGIQGGEEFLDGLSRGFRSEIVDPVAGAAGVSARYSPVALVEDRVTGTNVTERSVESFVQGVGDVLDVPQIVRGLDEGGELIAYNVEGFNDGRGRETVGETVSAGVMAGDSFKTRLTSRPWETGSRIAGSFVGVAGTVGAASRVSGTAGRATSVALQPIEEGARLGAGAAGLPTTLRGAAASARGVSFQTPSARGRAGSVRERFRGDGESEFEVSFERDADAGLVEIDPQVRRQALERLADADLAARDLRARVAGVPSTISDAASEIGTGTLRSGADSATVTRSVVDSVREGTARAGAEALRRRADAELAAGGAQQQLRESVDSAADAGEQAATEAAFRAQTGRLDAEVAAGQVGPALRDSAVQARFDLQTARLDAEVAGRRVPQAARQGVRDVGLALDTARLDTELATTQARRRTREALRDAPESALFAADTARLDAEVAFGQAVDNAVPQSVRDVQATLEVEDSLAEALDVAGRRRIDDARSSFAIRRSLAGGRVEDRVDQLRDLLPDRAPDSRRVRPADESLPEAAFYAGRRRLSDARSSIAIQRALVEGRADRAVRSGLLDADDAVRALRDLPDDATIRIGPRRPDRVEEPTLDADADDLELDIYDDRDREFLRMALDESTDGSTGRPTQLQAGQNLNDGGRQQTVTRFESETESRAELEELRRQDDLVEQAQRDSFRRVETSVPRATEPAVDDGFETFEDAPPTSVEREMAMFEAELADDLDVGLDTSTDQFGDTDLDTWEGTAFETPTRFDQPTGSEFETEMRFDLDRRTRQRFRTPADPAPRRGGRELTDVPPEDEFGDDWFTDESAVDEVFDTGIASGDDVLEQDFWEN